MYPYTQTVTKTMNLKVGDNTGGKCVTKFGSCRVTQPSHSSNRNPLLEFLVAKNLIEEAIPEPNYDVLLLGVIPRVCPGAAHGFTSLWRHSSVGVSLDSVAWSPLACAPLMWRPCRVDHLTTPSAADGITPGPADDLVRPEVLDAFLVGRAECSPNLWFSDDQERKARRKIHSV